MQKKTIIAIVLCIAVWLLWSALFVEPPKRRAIDKGTDGDVATAEKGKGTGKETGKETEGSEVEFEIEMTVGRGRSYATADDHKAKDGEQIIGVIPVDSVYSPVTH